MNLWEKFARNVPPRSASRTNTIHWSFSASRGLVARSTLVQRLNPGSHKELQLHVLSGVDLRPLVCTSPRLGDMK